MGEEMMDWQFIFALFSGIILFLYGIEHISAIIREIRKTILLKKGG